MRYGYDGGYPPYVSAAQRHAKAKQKLAQLRKKGGAPAPVVLAPRAPIATTVWGKAWCEHLESFADYATRLPRGRSYVRGGSVIDLQIARGEVRALVCGSEVYEVMVAVVPLAVSRWKAVRKECAGQVGTVVELLSGKLSDAVMAKLCHRERGLFPATREIHLECSCPDGARLCKHLAAVLYGVGARLDEAPELLFTLRGVDGAELAAAALDGAALTAVGAPACSASGALGNGELADLFGIELAGGDAPVAVRAGRASSPPGRATGTRRKGPAPEPPRRRPGAARKKTRARSGHEKE